MGGFAKACSSDPAIYPYKLVDAGSANCVADREMQLPTGKGLMVRQNPNQCEAIVHATRQTLAADPSLWCLQADFCNAFNLVDRATALAKVEELFPEILNWVNTCYGQPSNLLFGSTSLSSGRGFHQGDPLASLLFCLVLLQLVNLIKERVPDLPMNAWFLDDGTFLGTLDQLREVVEILQVEGPSQGLILDQRTS